MAKTRITNYTYTPGAANTGVVKLMGKIDIDRILLITNTTRNEIIYNFADATRGAVSVTHSLTEELTNIGNNYEGVTTITLKLDTTSHSSSDKLLVYVEDMRDSVKIRASEVLVDPVDKMRVSTPQSMIDTDFEYSVQPSKWENLSMVQNYHSLFPKGSGANTFDIADVVGNNASPYSTMTVTTSTAHGLVAGDVISINETTNQLAEGTFFVQTASGTTLTYLAKGQVNGSIFDIGLTTLTGGGIYDFSGIPMQSVTTAPVALATPTVSPFTTIVTTGSGIIGQSTITVGSNAGIVKGLKVSGTGINAAAYVTDISGTTITLSNTNSGNVSGNVSFAGNASGGRHVRLDSVTEVYVNTNLVAANVPANSLIVEINGTDIFLNSTLTGATSGAVTINGSDVTITTVNPHGLLPATAITTLGLTSTTNPPNGNWTVHTLETPTTMVFSSPFYTVGAVSIPGSARLYTRPEGYVQHRATDGGVSITTGTNLIGVQIIRQTRRYFRYQSGKSMQFSTGVKFTPTFDIDSLVASSSGAGTKTVNVKTFQDHIMQVGASVRLEGIRVGSGSNPYNGTFPVTGIVSTKEFTVSMTADSGFVDIAPGGVELYATCVAWKGSTVRSGMYDEQNGFYFEYDGQTLFAARRQSIKEMFGKVTCTQNSGLVTGTNTRFREQLIVGDKIVIKGQSYEIVQITSDTDLRIQPVYRGPTAQATQAKYLKTQNFYFPQSKWNLDKMDGTGPSGYTLDVGKMQMAYIDYTWYGAGFIRYGFRGPMGDIVYCHKVANNNINTSAYMRSGNLPARFEVANYGYNSRLVAGAVGTRGSALQSGDTTLYVEDAEFWPSEGYVFVQDTTNAELVRYTGKGAYNSTARGYPLTGLTRRTSYTTAGVDFTGTFTATGIPTRGGVGTYTFTPDVGVGGLGVEQVSVQYAYNDCAPVVSHWGVSVIMDGRYDVDKEIRFTAGMLRYLTVAQGEQRPLLMIRISPSVDSGTGRNYGIRELVNRMQLTLKELSIYSQGTFLIEGILNPATITGGGWTSASNWQTSTVGSGSLAQVYYFNGSGSTGSNTAATGAFTGGDRIFGTYTEFGGGTRQFNNTNIELTDVRDLGTSIISGDGSNPNWCFPNGPDVLLISARNIGSENYAIASRISWTEAQA